MATDAEKRLEVAGADANLVFFFEDHALPLDQQCGLVHAGYNSLRRFTRLGDTKPAFRTAVAAELTLDAATAPGRLLLSILVGIWDAANQYVSKEVTLRAEAKVLGVVKVVVQDTIIAPFGAIDGILNYYLLK